MGVVLLWQEFLDFDSFGVLCFRSDLGGPDLGLLFLAVAGSVNFYCVAFQSVLGPVELRIE